MLICASRKPLYTNIIYNCIKTSKNRINTPILQECLCSSLGMQMVYVYLSPSKNCHGWLSRPHPTWHRLTSLVLRFIIRTLTMVIYPIKPCLTTPPRKCVLNIGLYFPSGPRESSNMFNESRQLRVRPKESLIGFSVYGCICNHISIQIHWGWNGKMKILDGWDGGPNWDIAKNSRERRGNDPRPEFRLNCGVMHPSHFGKSTPLRLRERYTPYRRQC
jgi:hypothetical protein